mgnify:FL=1
MPLPRRIIDDIPAWTMKVDDDCARGLIRSFYATVLLAQKAGAGEHKSCNRMLGQAFEQVPTEAEIRSARSDTALDRICERIAKAERLVSRAEYCGERRSR